MTRITYLEDALKVDAGRVRLNDSLCRLRQAEEKLRVQLGSAQTPDDHLALHRCVAACQCAATVIDRLWTRYHEK